MMMMAKRYIDAIGYSVLLPSIYDDCDYVYYSVKWNNHHNYHDIVKIITVMISMIMMIIP